MRYEYKYEIPLGMEKTISIFLKSNGCKDIYAQRRVNSLYYDTVNYSIFYDSQNGLAQRNKIRARFYNSGDSGFKLECKHKNDLLNRKSFIHLDSQLLGDLVPIIYSERESGSPDLALPSKVLQIYKPKVLVGYTRNYILTYDGKVRFTIDTDLIFRRALLSNKKIKLDQPRYTQKSILELKYDEANKPNSFLLDKLCSKYNLNITRSSKYCHAISLLF